MPKRPWNLPDLPVYSLQTISKDGVLNFNICTYVSSVSMKPKRFMVAVYKDTKTLENLELGSKANLILLSKENIKLVRNFGKKSGTDIDKFSKIKDPTVEFQNMQVMQNAVAVMNLKTLQTLDAGDHIIYLFDLEKHKTLSGKEILYLSDLWKSKIISV